VWNGSAFQLHDPGGGENRAKKLRRMETSGRRRGRWIDLVADNKHFAWSGQQAHQLVLHAVGVLVFVDVNILEARLPLSRVAMIRAAAAERRSRSSKSKALLSCRSFS